jgi:hypothetical protein
LDYHTIHIDLAGAAASEPLVNLKDYGVVCRSAYANSVAPYYKPFATALLDVFVRKSVAEKLVAVNKALTRALPTITTSGGTSITARRCGS